MNFLARVVVALWCLVPALAPAAGVPTPSQFLGMTVGADRTLADYRQISSYFRALEKASPRVKVENLGKTTLGEDMLLAIITSEGNQRNLPRLQEIARKLSDPRGLSDSDVAALTKEGKVVLLVTCNIHASEIGSTQMAMEWAHALATADDPETKRRLENVVLLLLPSLNPDGQIMETEWYRKNLGTKYEGGRLPWLYHPYVGHDNNRDWYMLTQKETKALNRAVYKEWFPQVWLDEHQMGSNGPRIFMPPYAEPVAAEVHPLVWREVNLIGSSMALRLEQNGKTGVIYGYSFDAYWPGGTKNTGWWKNIAGLLTEVASVRLASPVFLPPGELTGGRKGLIDYRAQTNFPNPWPGGWWRLRDIMDYERIASDAILESCADRREDFLKDMAVRARASIAAFSPGDAYRIPMGEGQRDPATALHLARLMSEHGVDVRSAPNGDAFLPLAQPYGRFVREMMEPQRYPEVKLVAGKEIVRPYDVATWTLPAMMGVKVERATLPGGLTDFDPGGKEISRKGFRAAALLPGSPEGAKVVNAALKSGALVSILRRPESLEGRDWPAGTTFLSAPALDAAAAPLDATRIPLFPLKEIPSLPSLSRLRAPRVALYKSFTSSMDEGWTRWLLERYGFAPVSLENKAVRAGGLAARFDVIVLPDMGAELIATGRPRLEEGESRYVRELPPEYQGGLEKEGAKALRDFVEAGGTLVAFDSATDYVANEFSIPVRNVLARAKREDFLCPGSLLRVKVDSSHPVTWGLPSEVAVFLDDATALQTSLPGAELERWVLASYPDDARDVLVSGWIHGADRLTRRAAAVATTFGRGKLVLLGFRPQHRAQTHATFPFLFNALYWSVEGPPPGSRAEGAKP